jgi:hypothetical protein
MTYVDQAGRRKSNQSGALPRLMRLAATIQEARRQRARPTLVVGCPGVPAAHVITVRSRFGPMCSACGAVIDRSPSHRIIEVGPSVAAKRKSATVAVLRPRSQQ